MKDLPPHKRQLLVMLAAAGMAAYIGLALSTDADHIASALRRVGAAGVLAVLGLSLLNYALRFWRWSLYLEALGHRLPPARHLAYYLGGFAFTVSPGKAGEAVRSLYLKQHGVPYSTSLAALFSERLLDALAVTALSTLLLLADTGHRALVAGAALLLLVIAWCAGRPRVHAALRAHAGGNGPVPRIANGLARLLESAAQLLQWKWLLPGFVIGLVAWGAEGYGLFLLAGYLGNGFDVETAVGIYALSVLAGAAAFFMPAGLGGMEAAMIALLVAHGAGFGAAAAVTLLCRLATLWFAVVLGMLALAWLERPGREALA